MPNTIQHKRNSTASAVPTAISLALGEIAINTADARLFIKRSDGVVVAIGRDASELNAGTVAAARLPAATGSTLGAIVVGTGLGVASGTVSVSYGSTSSTACVGNDSRLSDARTPLSHTHGNITNAGAIGSTANLPVITTTSGVLTVGSFGTTANTFCQGNDSRLSDSRTPTAHKSTHATGGTDALTAADIGAAATSHAHGNLTSAGAIGSTANLPVITTTSGVLTTGSFGTTTNTFCQGNDSRLSDSRTPTDGTVTTAKIVDANVTYAKIQNVSATDRLLGRSSAGAGSIEEIACTSDARAILSASNVYAARAWVNFDGTAASNLSATYSLSSTTLTVTSNSHGFAVNQQVYLDFTTGTATDGTYTITGVTTNTFTVTHTSGTTSGNVTVVRNTIKASGNVSSIADRGVGLYTINFTTAMSDNHYAAVVCANSDFAAPTIAYEDGGSGTRTTLTLPIAVVNSSFALADRSRINVVIFR